jgi:hypothetical protein
VATFAVFAVAGVLHDLVAVAFNPAWGPVFTFAYCAFACLSLVSFRLAAQLKQDKWPAIANILLNGGLVVITIEASRRLYWHLVAEWR